MIGFLTTLLPILQTVLILAGLIGGAIAGVSIFKNAKNTGIVQIQSETIIAMQAQIDALNSRRRSMNKTSSCKPCRMQWASPSRSTAGM